MSLDPRQNPIAIVTAIATLAGLFLAFQVGEAAANNNMRFIVFVLAAGAGLLIVLTMQSHIWLLVPLCWPLTGNLGWLPLPFSVREMAVLAAFGVFVVQVAMKTRTLQSTQFNMAEACLWLNVLCVATMFARNPVGVAFLQTDTVGGRPYLSVIIGLMAFLLLRFAMIPEGLAKWFPAFLLGPNMFVGILGSLTVFFPFLTPIIHPIYSGIDISSYVSEEFGGGAQPLSLENLRVASFSSVGTAILTFVVIYNNPLKAMGFGYPKLFFLMALGTFLVGMSGFRNMLFVAVMIVLIAAFLWGGIQDLVKTLLAGCLIVGAVMAAQTVVELPRSIQRSFSFIPGPWNEDVKKGSKQSTDWRVEMWTIALTTDRYIKNKILGDGFGFSREELEIMFNASIGAGPGFIGTDNTKESFMIQGSFHSGPVSTIRFAGVVGLVLIVMLYAATARYAWRLFQKSKRTPLMPLAMLLAIISFYQPLYFLFVFGEYRYDLPNAFFYLGMLKLLDNSLLAFRNPTSQTDQTPPLWRTVAGRATAGV